MASGYIKNIAFYNVSPNFRKSSNVCQNFVPKNTQYSNVCLKAFCDYLLTHCSAARVSVKVRVWFAFFKLPLAPMRIKLVFYLFLLLLNKNQRRKRLFDHFCTSYVFIWLVCSTRIVSYDSVHSYPKSRITKWNNVSEGWCIFLKSKLYSKKYFSKILGLGPSPLDPHIFWK